MFRKTVSEIVLMLLLLGVSALAFDVQPVKSEPKTWTVDDDGPADFHTIGGAINAADPGDIIFVHGGTYYCENLLIDKPVSVIGENKSATVIDGMGAQAAVSIGSNVTLSGFTIQNGSDGVWVWGHESNVSGNILRKNGYGIYVGYADENVISRNIVTQNGFGIEFDCASGNIVRYNTITDNIFNFKVFGVELSHFIHDIDASNTVNGKPIYYLINERNIVVDTLSYPDIGYLAVVNSSSVILRNLNLTKNGNGVMFAFCTNCTMMNVTVSSCEFGIYLCGTGGNMVLNSTLTNNRRGILDHAGGNIIYHNNFIDNYYQASIRASVPTTWDGGYPSGGNYWSDYTGVDLYSGSYQNETGSDGIGDTPYNINEKEKDRYPLMAPWNSSSSLTGDVNDDGVVDIKDIALIARAFGSSLGDPRYNSKYDLNNDDIINIIDVATAARNYGKTW